MKSFQVLVFAYAFHLICGIVYEPEPEADNEIGKVSLQSFYRILRSNFEPQRAINGTNVEPDSTKNLLQQYVRLVKIGLVSVWGMQEWQRKVLHQNLRYI